MVPIGWMWVSRRLAGSLGRFAPLGTCEVEPREEGEGMDGGREGEGRDVVMGKVMSLEERTLNVKSSQVKSQCCE